jgi:hypothetical protein
MGRETPTLSDVSWQQLSCVVEAWSDLPSHILAAILALVRAAKL